MPHEHRAEEQVHGHEHDQAGRREAPAAPGQRPARPVRKPLGPGLGAAATTGGSVDRWDANHSDPSRAHNAAHATPAAGCTWVASTVTAAGPITKHTSSATDSTENAVCSRGDPASRADQRARAIGPVCGMVAPPGDAAQEQRPVRGAQRDGAPPGRRPTGRRSRTPGRAPGAGRPGRPAGRAAARRPRRRSTRPPTRSRRGRTGRSRRRSAAPSRARTWTWASGR